MGNILNEEENGANKAKNDPVKTEQIKEIEKIDLFTGIIPLNTNLLYCYRHSFLLFILMLTWKY